ncbi:hypothetical protein [Altererythrobacter aquiaggeris]|uniref:hypothetical protein n=1 Tax=Aestuarierythrobacter aquiaggeris TaxID=1898396 RepID=UPI0030193DC6
MASYNEQLQNVWHQYEKEHGFLPSTARDAVAWGVARQMIALPELDPFDAVAKDMSRALREEYGTDRLGRRYRKNHAVRVSKAGVQHTMWAIMGNAPLEHMRKAFVQRREQVVGDCVQLATDVEVYNDLNPEQEKIQVPFDFTDDVEERLLLDDKQAA